MECTVKYTRLRVPHLLNGLLSSIQCTLIFLLSLTIAVLVDAQSSNLGDPQTSVPWRAAHSAVMVMDYMIVFGGVSTSQIYTDPVGSNSVLVWDTKTLRWYTPEIKGSIQPLGQKFAPAVTLPSQNAMLVLLWNMTASDASLTARMVIRLDCVDWNWLYPQPTQTFNPPQRAIGVSFTLSSNDTFWFYGGAPISGNNQATSATNLLWALDTNYQWSPKTNGPALVYHSACYMSDYDTLVYFGGQNADNQYLTTVSTFSLQMASWNLDASPKGGNGPGARASHTAVCTNNQMIMFGGGTSTSPADGVIWLLTGTPDNFSWSQPTIQNANAGPGSRMGHSAVLYDNNTKMAIWGGAGARNNDTQVYVLDINNWKWTVVDPAGNSGEFPSQTTALTSPSPAGGSNKTNILIAIISGIVGGLLFLLILIALIIICWRRRKYNNRKIKHVSGRTSLSGKRRSRKFDEEESDRIRDISYRESDDPSVDILANGRERRATEMSDTLLIPTPAAARVANKDTILGVASLFTENNKSRGASRHSGDTFGTRKNIPEEEEDRWTFASSSSIDQNRGTPPIRYMNAQNRRTSSSLARTSINYGTPPLPPPHQSDYGDWMQHQLNNYDDDYDDDGGPSVPLALPVTPPDVIVTAPFVPTNPAPVSPTMPPEYVNAARMSATPPGVGTGAVGDDPDPPATAVDGPNSTAVYDGLSPLDRIVQFFSGGDATGAIERSEKESGRYQHHQPPAPHSASPENTNAQQIDRDGERNVATLGENGQNLKDANVRDTQDVVTDNDDADSKVVPGNKNEIAGAKNPVTDPFSKSEKAEGGNIEVEKSDLHGSKIQDAVHEENIEDKKL